MRTVLERPKSQILYHGGARAGAPRGLTEPQPREKCTQKRSRYQKRCEFYNKKKNQYDGEGYALKRTRGDILET